jgi:hypothetical protein
MIVGFWTWLRYLLFRKSRKELDDEVQFHLEQLIAAQMEAGVSAPEARRQALIEFGGVAATRERCEELEWMAWVSIVRAQSRDNPVKPIQRISRNGVDRCRPKSQRITQLSVKESCT